MVCHCLTSLIWLVFLFVCSLLVNRIGLLILITSAPTHRDARLAIRQTWGHYASRRDIAMAFVLGATNIQSIEDSLEAESYMYSDIIRGRFIDSYNNLTLKTISSLEWVDTYCPRAAFVLKTDDDMFINVLRLMAFIDKHRNEEHQKIIFGRLAKRLVYSRLPHKNQFAKDIFHSA